MQASSTWAVMAGCLVVACGSSDSDGPRPEVLPSAALLRFDSCQAVETYLQENAIEEMKASIAAIRKGGFAEDDGAVDGGGGALQPGAPASGDSSEERTDSPDNFTDTNTQVEGVDEPDFVKTDGVNTYVLTGQTLYKVQSWPPEELSLTQTLTVPGWPIEMFLDENGRVIVLSSIWPANDKDHPDEVVGPFPDAIFFDCGPWGCGGFMPYTQLTVIDTSDDNLRIAGSYDLPGRYHTARRMGDTSRLVLVQDLIRPADLQYWITIDSERYDSPQADKLWEELINANIQKIQSHPLEAWLPEGLFPKDSSKEDIEALCGNFHRPSHSMPLGLISVVTVNLSTLPASVQMTSVFSQVHQIYASTKSLYVTSTEWVATVEDGEQNISFVHKFDIQDETKATYVGSGTFPGYVLNQFSIDEYDDHLRVATTRNTWRQDEEQGFTAISTNGISILKETNGELVTVGEISNLALDERITSARFMGTRGFMVTFRQIDPLFTLDLSDPTDPKVVGELKIPGFSTYLHPLGDNHLLALGEDFPEPDENGNLDWSERSLKVSIFDVSDLSRPTEQHIHRLGSFSSSSEALWNHKAFNYFDEKGTLAIPFTDYLPKGGDTRNVGEDYWSSFVSDVRLFSIDLETGIEPMGALSMSDVFIRQGNAEWSYIYSPHVRRSIMADDYVYGITDAGIKVAPMSDPETPIASVVFDGVIVDDDN